MNKSLLLILCGVIAIHSCSAAKKDNIRIDRYVYAVTEGDSLRMEVYTDPSQSHEEPQPCLFYVHGGGWDSDDNETGGRKWMRKMVEKGYVCTSISYRQGIRRIRLGQVNFGPEFNFGESYDYTVRIAVEDIFDATRFLLERADEFNIDPGKIIVVGSSAGAISLCTAEYRICHQDEIATSRLPEGFNYAAVISGAGGVWYRDTKEPEWIKKPCPFLLYHGDQDQLVPYVNSVREEDNFSAWGSVYLADQLEKMEVPFLFVSSKDCDHIMAGLPMVTNCEQMQSFIERAVFGDEKLYKRVTEVFLDEPRTIPYFLKHLAKYKDEL